jgi:arsenite methyltransferase
MQGAGGNFKLLCGFAVLRFLSSGVLQFKKIYSFVFIEYFYCTSISPVLLAFNPGIMNKYLFVKFDLNKLADLLDEIPIWSAPFGLKLLDYVDYKPGISVLDIGCGTGFPSIELAMRLGESSTVYGIDPWEKAIKRANKKIEQFGIKNIKIIKGFAESIPMDKASIDLITSNNGINNVTEADKVLSECSRVIKNGGQFVQTMNTDKSMFEFYTEFEYVLSDMHMNREIDLMRQHIVQKRPPLDNMISMIRKHGFKITDLEQCQFNYKFTDGSAMLNHYFIKLAFMDPWLKILPASKAEQVFAAVETRLNEQSHKSGCMKLSIPFVLINAIKI